MTNGKMDIPIAERGSTLERDPTNFTLLNMYGDRSFFEEGNEKGYTEVAIAVPRSHRTAGEKVSDYLSKHFGMGVVGKDRIRLLFALHHPKGQVATYEEHRMVNYLGDKQSRQVEKTYSPKQYKELLKKHRLEESGRKSMADFMLEYGPNLR